MACCSSRRNPQQLPSRSTVLCNSVPDDPVYVKPFCTGGIHSDLPFNMPVSGRGSDGTCHVRGICLPDSVYDTDGNTGGSDVYGRGRIRFKGTL